MDFETTGLVIRLVTAWVGAGEVACFSEMSAIVGEQGTEGDEGFLTAWEFTLVGPLRLKVDPLVTGESGSTAKPLTADLTDKGIILLMDFNMSLKVVDCGETPPTSLKLAGMWPLLVMGLKMPFQLVRCGESPAAALYGTLVGTWVFSMVQEVNFEFLTCVKCTGATCLRAAKGGHSLFLGLD